MVVAGILMIGGVVWVFGFRSFMRMLATPATEESETEIPGRGVDDVRKAILRAAAGPQTRIIEKTENTVHLESELAQGSRRTRRVGVSAAFIIDKTSSGVTLKTLIDFKRLRTTQCVLSGVMVLLGLVAISAAGIVMWMFVVDSPKPAVRWQAFQAFQIMHFLWPPFLFSGIHRRGRVAARSLVANIVSAAEFTE